MSSGIASGLGSGPLSRMVSLSSALKGRYETLLRQSADGRASDNYGDLAPKSRLALSLKGEIARREATAEGIGRALSRTESAQNTLERLSAITREFVATANRVGYDKPAEIASAASAARSALAEVGALLNERSGGEYLFAGSDSANPPVPDSDLNDSGMAARIRAAMGSLGVVGETATLAETADAATSPTAAESPFSAHLQGAGATEARRVSLLDDGTALPTGLWANRDAFAGGSGDPAASWSRNLLRSLMTLAALPDAGAATQPQVEAVMASVRADLSGAIGGLALEQGTLGQTEARLEASRSRHVDLVTALRGQVSAIEEVDFAAALAASQDAKNNLDASWRALSALSEMSLSKFLR